MKISYMVKCVACIGLEDNSSHKGVAMLRFILSESCVSYKSRNGLLEVQLLFIFLNSVWFVDHGV